MTTIHELCAAARNQFSPSLLEDEHKAIHVGNLVMRAISCAILKCSWDAQLSTEELYWLARIYRGEPSNTPPGELEMRAKERLAQMRLGEHLPSMGIINIDPHYRQNVIMDLIQFLLRELVK